MKPQSHSPFKNTLKYLVLLFSSISTQASNVEIAWQESADPFVLGYRVYLGESPGAYTDSFDAGTNSNFEFTSLEEDKEYFCVVTAYNGLELESLPSNEIVIQIDSEVAGEAFDDSLMAYWTFNGTNLDVVSERAADLSQAATSSEGRYGDALEFGSQTERATVDAFDVSGDQLTLACWVHPISFEGFGREARFISKATSTPTGAHDWMIGNYDNGDATLRGTALRFRLSLLSEGGRITQTLVTDEGLLQLNKWSHVAATYDGTSMKIFLNGSEVGSQPASGQVATSPANIGLGNQPQLAGDRGLLGRLDEVRIYDAALTRSELDRIMGDEVDVWASGFGLPVAMADNVDSDGDGIPHLLEYAFDLNPLSPSKLPIVIDGANFQYPVIRDDLNYSPSYSTDMRSWSSTNPGGAKVFFRLAVSRITGDSPGL